MLRPALQYDETYLAQGIESAANKGQVFAKLVNTVPLAFGGSGGSADKVGGLLTPSMEISGLSRLLGPVAGTLASGHQRPVRSQGVLPIRLGRQTAGRHFPGGRHQLRQRLFRSARQSSEVCFQPPAQRDRDLLYLAAGNSGRCRRRSGQPAFFKVTGDRSQALTVNATLTKTLDNQAAQLCGQRGPENL